jgi:hypothetical protein
VVVGQARQRSREPAPLGGRQRLEQRVLRGLDASVETLERARSGTRQLHGIAAPVLLVAHSSDEAIALEVVEDGMQVAAIDP